jgi:membrane-bound serine protease (ClpP class)
VSIPLVVGTGIVLGISFAAIIGFALRAQRAPVLTGLEALKGAEGAALDEIAPRGQVQVQSEQWSAELAEGAELIHKGERIQVVAIDGLRLKVRKK